MMRFAFVAANMEKWRCNFPPNKRLQSWNAGRSESRPVLPRSGRETDCAVLDLQKLATFRAVALSGNFTRAAAELGYSQSNVTMQVQALERELGAPLFERYRFSKTIALTAVGRRTLKYAERLLALADETKAAVHRV